MATPATPPPSRQDLTARLRPFGQEHVLRWWEELTAVERAQLARQIVALDLAQLQQLFQQSQSASHRPGWSGKELKPAPVLRPASTPAERLAEQHARALGEAALRAGQVAVLIVAGGQGTRLGFDGPKGMFGIGPVTGASLYQILSEKVLARKRRCKAPLPVLWMTGPENDSATRAFFARHACFGLPPEDVLFFPQGTMPAVDRRDGKLLLAGKGQLALSPDGHGGVLAALARSGQLDALRHRSVRYVYFCQVDNPLVKVADPLYLGQHIAAIAEASLKIVGKLGPTDPLGNVVEVDGRMQIIEYTELPKELAERRDGAGSLYLWAGSIAIHVFSLAFLERLSAGAGLLPFHQAVKKVACLDESGNLTRPTEANAVKFERFIFDALPRAERALAVEASRSEEFEPLKNASGEYSPQSVRQAMSNLYAEWLTQAGIQVPRRSDGAAAVPIEISPLYANEAAELCERRPQLAKLTGPCYLGEKES